VDGSGNALRPLDLAWRRGAFYLNLFIRGSRDCPPPQIGRNIQRCFFFSLHGDGGRIGVNKSPRSPTEPIFLNNSPDSNPLFFSIGDDMPFSITERLSFPPQPTSHWGTLATRSDFLSSYPVFLRRMALFTSCPAPPFFPLDFKKSSDADPI